MTDMLLRATLAVGDLLFGWTLLLPSVLPVAVLGILTSGLMLLVRRWTTDQDLLVGQRTYATDVVFHEPDTDKADRARHVPYEICCFEKPLQWMDYETLSDTLAEAGYDGVEATVRQGGHIEPERVEDELPKMAHALKQRGLKIHVMASSIDEADHPLTEKVLRTAAA